MSCKLITRMVRDGEDGVLSEKEYTQERITIGRGPTNDVVLKDPARVVSTKHAEIRAGNKGWFVLDVGSTNGTAVNGARIPPKQEHILRDGDRITLGPFQLVFESGDREAIRESGCAYPPSSEAPGTSHPDTERILYLLRRAYGETDASSVDQVEKSLVLVLRRALGNYDADKVRTTVRSVKAAALPSTSQLEPLPAVNPPPREPSIRGGSMPGPSDGELAKFVCEELRSTGAVLDPEYAGKQIARILRTVFGGLADAVRGRREFQKEFEVEATRIMGMVRNPIKYAESATEIGSILFHPESFGMTLEQATEGLREVFQDLTLHQLGLMAGFRECIKALLQELDPEVLEKSKEDRSGKTIPLLGGSRVRSEAAAWRRYIEKHRQLREEEVKVFERILAPHFAKGYLSVHRTKRRS